MGYLTTHRSRPPHATHTNSFSTTRSARSSKPTPSTCLRFTSPPVMTKVPRITSIARCPKTNTISSMTHCSPRSLWKQKDWEKLNYFESCLPIEEIARRGRDTLRFGPMKPVGLKDPRTGRIPYAVGSAPARESAGRFLQSRRISESFEIRRTGECAAVHPRTGKCSLPAVRADPPQHLHQLRLRCLLRHLQMKKSSPASFCGPNLRSRRLRGVHRHGILAGINAAALAADNGLSPTACECVRIPHSLHHASRSQKFSARQHNIRSSTRARNPRPRP